MIYSQWNRVSILSFLVLMGGAGMTSQAEPKLVTESYMIQSRDPGIQLYVRNKRPEGMTQFSPEKTLLYVHGTSQAASSTFDLPLDGLSWMDYIAQHGYDVYLVDLRGYGGSTRPPEMEKPAAENPPIVRTDVAVKDVGAAVDHILARRGRDQTQFNGLVLGYGDHGPIRDAKQRQSQSPGALCAALDTRSASDQQLKLRLGHIKHGRWSKRGAVCKMARRKKRRKT